MRQESLLTDFGLPGAPLVLDSVLVHAALKTFLQSTCAALVTVRLVDGTFSLQVGGGLAGVNSASVN